MILLRLVQLLLLIPMVVGVQQIWPLSSEIQLAFEEQAWPLPRLCGRLAAVTGPLLIPASVIWLLEITLRHLATEKQRKAAHPNEPWMVRPEWAAKRMRLSNRPVVLGVLCFMAVYVLVALPLAIASEKTPFLVFAGAFGLFGLLFVRMFWLNRTWNRAELRIATLPGVIGGPFSGAVILQEKFPADTVFDINLRCEQTDVQRRRKQSQVSRVDLWTSTIYVQRPLGGSEPGTIALPIGFAIPFEAQPTGVIGDRTIRWWLSVQKKEDVSTGGATFEIPVYRTAESRQNYELDTELMQPYLAVFDPEVVLKRFGLREQKLTGGSFQLHFREFDLSIFSTLIVMSLGLIGILVGLWYWIVDRNTLFFAMLFPAVFLLMFLYGIVYMLLWRCRIDHLVSQADPAEETLAELASEHQPVRNIQAEAGIWGFRKSIRVPGDRTSSLRCQIDHRANNKESWSLWLQGKDKQSLKLLNTLNGAPEAEAIAKYLADKLGISVVKITAQHGTLRS